MSIAEKLEKMEMPGFRNGKNIFLVICRFLIILLFIMADTVLALGDDPIVVEEYQFENDQINHAGYLYATFTETFDNKLLTIEIINAEIVQNALGCDKPTFIYSENSLHAFWPKFCVAKNDKVKIKITFKVTLGDKQLDILPTRKVKKWNNFVGYNVHPQLDWEDFNVEPKRLSPNIDAQISCRDFVINNELDYINPNKIDKDGWTIDTKQKNLKVLSVLFNDDTYVVQGKKDPKLLSHEQGHWSLCEIFALKLTIRLMAIPPQNGNGADTKSAQTDAKNKLVVEQNKVITTTREESKDVNGGRKNVNGPIDGRYDQQTGHGTNLAQEAIWEAAIKNCLNGLQTNVANKKWEIPKSCDDKANIGEPLSDNINNSSPNYTNIIYDTSSDFDEDGIVDLLDNCIFIYNPLQEDFNEDRLGDVCSDTDRDGLFDDQEFETKTDPQDADSDGDLVIDGIEVVVASNPLLSDTDGDSIDDFKEDALIIPEPSMDPFIESSDKYGRKKDIFYERVMDEYGESNSVYIIGNNLQSSQTFPIYIVNDNVWNQNDIIIPIVAATVYTDSNGVLPVQQIWTSGVSGRYDIILDANSNYMFDPDIDILDDMDIDDAGFLISKLRITGRSFRLFGLLISIICLLIIGILALKKIKKKVDSKNMYIKIIL